MKIEDIRELTTAELQQKVFDLKADLMTLRFQQKSGELENGKRSLKFANPSPSA